MTRRVVGLPRQETPNRPRSGCHLLSIKRGREKKWCVSTLFHFLECNDVLFEMVFDEQVLVSEPKFAKYDTDSTGVVYKAMGRLAGIGSPYNKCRLLLSQFKFEPATHRKNRA